MPSSSTPPALTQRGDDVLIAGLGARTASGLTALQVTMSARARKLAPRPTHMLDRSGEAMAMARLLSIADDVFGLERLVALGGPTLIQAAFPWLSARRHEDEELPVVLALPSERRPGFDRRTERDLLPALEARSRVPLDRARSQLITSCRAGGVIAFKRGIQLIRQGCPAVLVGGIDSYFDPDTLEDLDRALRLHGPETEDGFIPGEGAGFVLLVPRGRASGIARSARLVAAASELEPRPYGSDEPCLAQGITRAVRRAAAGVGVTRRIPWALTDVPNERWRVEEWMYAFGRNFEAFTPDVVHEQPLLRTGDLGAASAAVLVAMAATRWQTGCAVGDVALIATLSDGAERGALVVAAEPGEVRP